MTARSANSLTLFLRIGAIHAVVSAQDPQIPVSYLRALVRIALHAVYMTLSSAFGDFLSKRANADVAEEFIDPTHLLAQCALNDALAHPLPYCLAPLPLHCPTGPSFRAGVIEILRQALVRWKEAVKYALVFTASPPYPRKLIATGGHANKRMSPMDVNMLMSLVPGSRNERMGTLERVYLQSERFEKACSIVARPVELRLQPEDFETFRTAVGGTTWRPEWNTAGGDVVWVMALVKRGAETVGEQFLDLVEEQLDRQIVTRDLMVCMERPWTLADMHVAMKETVREGVRAIVFIGGRRITGTVGSFAYREGLQVMRCLGEWETKDMKVEAGDVERGRDWLVIKFERDRGFVVLWKGRFAACFDGRVDVEEAKRAVGSQLVPWMKRFKSSLLPEHEHAYIPPQTPLAGILAPFQV